MKDTSQTALYRLFGRDGMLLYVGISKDFGTRWQQHAMGQPWWPEVHRQMIDWCPTWEDAEDAERLAIRTERPKYNKRGTLPAPSGKAVPVPGPARPRDGLEVERIPLARISRWAAYEVPEATTDTDYWVIECPICGCEHHEDPGTQVHRFRCAPESARRFTMIAPASAEDERRLVTVPDPSSRPARADECPIFDGVPLTECRKPLAGSVCATHGKVTPVHMAS